MNFFTDAMNAPLYFGALWTVTSSLALVGMYRKLQPSRLLLSIAIWTASAVLAAALTWQITGSLNGLLLPAAVTALLTLAAYMFMPLTPFGVGLLARRLYLPVCTMIFVREYANGRDWSVLALLGTCVLGLLSLAATLFGTLFGDLSGLSLRFSRREKAREVIEGGRGKSRLKVSIHVPCYSEPPQLVIATLDAISRLRHANFEVLVVDNNTQDPGLWKPVEAHCKSLGNRFRFFHVDPLSGAKAGALNFALKHTSADADVVAVIDADYITEPDFLEKYTPLFADPLTGFVQTSHDYHRWANNRFLSGAYYEYVLFHKLSLPALNEFGNGFTVGTMCLVRRRALEKAGGWSEWCLTEDSELAVRIHALGYAGHTFADTAGRGLIPETMEGMKKQQFRWTAGPVQQLLMHWRLYFGCGGNGRLNVTQRLLELKHSFDRAPYVASFLTVIPVSLFSMHAILNHSVIAVAPAVLAPVAAGMLANLLEKWICVQLLGAKRFSDFVYSIMAGAALEWTYITGVLTPLFKSNIAWRRTNKFKESFSFMRALHSSRTETLLALAHLGAAAGLLYFASFETFDLLALTAMWLLLRGLCFLCTLVMALIGEHELYSAYADSRAAASSSSMATSPGYE